jgi:hypothetical protein
MGCLGLLQKARCETKKVTVCLNRRSERKIHSEAKQLGHVNVKVILVGCRMAHVDAVIPASPRLTRVDRGETDCTFHYGFKLCNSGLPF